jgi:hypothetical protein
MRGRVFDFVNITFSFPSFAIDSIAGLLWNLLPFSIRRSVEFFLVRLVLGWREILCTAASFLVCTIRLSLLLIYGTPLDQMRSSGHQSSMASSDITTGWMAYVALVWNRSHE